MSEPVTKLYARLGYGQIVPGRNRSIPSISVHDLSNMCIDAKNFLDHYNHPGLSSLGMSIIYLRRRPTGLQAKLFVPSEYPPL